MSQVLFFERGAGGGGGESCDTEGIDRLVEVQSTKLYIGHTASAKSFKEQAMASFKQRALAEF